MTWQLVVTMMAVAFVVMGCSDGTNAPPESKEVTADYAAVEGIECKVLERPDGNYQVVLTCLQDPMLCAEGLKSNVYTKSYVVAPELIVKNKTSDSASLTAFRTAAKREPNPSDLESGTVVVTKVKNVLLAIGRNGIAFRIVSAQEQETP